MSFKAVLVVIFGVVVGISLTTLGFLYFQSNQPKLKTQQDEIPRVFAYAVPQPDFTRQVRVEGAVDELPGQGIVMQTSGQVAELFVDAGQTVKKGDPLMRLDDTAIRNAYQNLQMKLGMAQANYQLAMLGDFAGQAPQGLAPDSQMLAEVTQAGAMMKNLRRVQTRPATGIRDPMANLDAALLQANEAMDAPDHGVEAFGNDAMPMGTGQTQKLQTAKQTYDKLLADLQRLRKAMASTTLTSPVSGRVKYVNIQHDDIVTPGQVVVELEPPAHRVMTAQMPVSMMRLLKKDQTVLIQIPTSYTILNAEGRIAGVRYPVKGEGNLGWVKVMQTQGNHAALKPGRKVDLYFQVPSEGRIWIPLEAVQRRQEKDVVLIIEHENRKSWVLERPVITGEIFQDKIEIKEGLDSGEKIVLEGANLLEHQQEVVEMGTNAFEP